MVAADRTFRAAIRSGRKAGLNLPQALRQANLVTLEKTGLDMLATLHAEDHLATLEAGHTRPSPSARPGPGSPAQFLADWAALKLQGSAGEVLPFCPCSGRHLYHVYQHWCAAAHARPARIQDLIGFADRLPGWQAGRLQSTWAAPDNPTIKSRKMVVPGAPDMAQASRHCQTGQQHSLQRERFPHRGQWLTAGFFAFESALGVTELVAG